MEAHPVLSHAAWRDACSGFDTFLLFLIGDRFDPVAEPPPGRTSFGPRRDPRADRGRSERRQQRLVFGHTIFAFLDPQSLEPSPDPSCRPRQHAGNVFGLGWVKRVEMAGRARGPFIVAVEHERMEVRCQVESRAEALDERDRAAGSALDPEVSLRAPTVVRKHRPEEATQHFGRELRVPGAAVSERIRKREHPLSDGDLGEDAIHEMDGGISHASTSA